MNIKQVLGKYPEGRFYPFQKPSVPPRLKANPSGKGSVPSTGSGKGSVPSTGSGKGSVCPKQNTGISKNKVYEDINKLLSKLDEAISCAQTKEANAPGEAILDAITGGIAGAVIGGVFSAPIIGLVSLGMVSGILLGFVIKTQECMKTSS